MIARTLAALGFVILAAGCSSKAAATTPAPAAKTFIASGTLDLDGQPDGGPGEYCQGAGGYNDIAAGAQVVIYNAAGTQLAIGALGSGSTVSHGPDTLATCRFRFSVPSVPSGVGPYSVEISHRGKIAFTEADARSIKLSIGD